MTWSFYSWPENRLTGPCRTCSVKREVKANYLLQTGHPPSSHPSPYRKLLQSKSQLSSFKVYKVISSLQFAHAIQRSLHMERNKQPISYNECGSLTCVALWLILLPARTASLSPVPTISPLTLLHNRYRCPDYFAAALLATNWNQIELWLTSCFLTDLQTSSSAAIKTHWL